MSTEQVARRVLTANGFKIYGAPLDGDNTRNWSARASVICLIACVQLDFELTYDGNQVTFKGIRKHDGHTTSVTRPAESLDDIALLAVSTKHRAEAS